MEKIGPQLPTYCRYMVMVSDKANMQVQPMAIN